MGAGSSGDIAIDDISIKHRICDKNKKKLTLGKRIGKFPTNKFCLSHGHVSNSTMQVKLH